MPKERCSPVSPWPDFVHVVEKWDSVKKKKLRGFENSLLVKRSSSIDAMVRSICWFLSSSWKSCHAAYDNHAAKYSILQNNTVLLHDHYSQSLSTVIFINDSTAIFILRYKDFGMQYTLFTRVKARIKEAMSVDRPVGRWYKCLTSYLAYLTLTSFWFANYKQSQVESFILIVFPLRCHKREKMFIMWNDYDWKDFRFISNWEVSFRRGVIHQSEASAWLRSCTMENLLRNREGCCKASRSSELEGPCMPCPSKEV